MLGCRDCQDLLLDHLYGLLDEAEARVVDEHLEQCSSCKAGLEKARTQQHLLASAARMHFPDVQFTAPVEQEAPRVVPFRPARRKIPAFRLALAASLLVGLSAGVLAFGPALRDYVQAVRLVQSRDVALADARETARTAQEQLRTALANRDEELALLDREIKARELRMVVSGPGNLLPGASAEYQIHAFDLNHQPADAELKAQLVHGNADKPQDLTIQSDGTGVYRINVPGNLATPENQSLAMVVSARKKGSASEFVSVQGKVHLSRPSLVTHLTTDKPIYVPGEIVRFRSLTLDQHTLRPASEPLTLFFTLKNGRGEENTVGQGISQLRRPGPDNTLVPVTGPDGKPVQGIGVGEFTLPPGAEGGEYTLIVHDQFNRCEPVRRKFLVNEYKKPRLDKKLVFHRATYSPGDEVIASASARLAGAGPVADKTAYATILVDERMVGLDGRETANPVALKTNAEGQVKVVFRLPAAMVRDEASLSIRFEDGGTPETIVRSIPLVTRNLDVTFYPEGGDLIAGLPTRVYFQARTSKGKPAQMQGTLLEEGKPLQVKVATLSDNDRPEVNQGNGVFAFTPRAGKKYELQIDTPAGVKTRKPLPAVLDEGVTMQVPRGVFESDESIRVKVYTTRNQPLLVSLTCRDQLLDTAELEAHQTEVILRPKSGVGGVCRVTVFEERNTGQPQRQLVPVAERLVYRNPRARLDVAITADRTTYAPGDRVKLDLRTNSEKKTPYPAIALLGVVDRSSITLADDKTDRRMATHFLLTTEVRKAEDLEYADFLLGHQPGAGQALDLLLGTQGWRRLAEQASEQFLARKQRPTQGAGGELLLLAGQSRPRSTDLDRQKFDKVTTEFARASAEYLARHASARETIAQRRNDEDYRAALGILALNKDRFELGRSVALGVLGSTLVFLALVGLLQGLRKQPRLAWNLAGGAAMCGLLLTLTWSAGRAPENLGRQGTLPEIGSLTLPAPGVEAMQASTLATPEARDASLAALSTPVPTAPQPGSVAPSLVRSAPTDGPPGSNTVKTKMGDAKANGLIHSGGIGTGGAKGPARMVPSPPRPMQAMRAPDRAAPQNLAAKKVGPVAAMADPRQPAEGLRAGPRELQANQDAALQQFRKEKGARGVEKRDRRPMDERPMDVQTNLPFVVREYAHMASKGDALRQDFTETIYWHPVLVLPDGKASVSFQLPDSVTSFEVLAQAHSLDGRLGTGVKVLESKLPFSLAPRVPMEVTASDRIELSVGISNGTVEPADVRLSLIEHDGLALTAPVPETPVRVAAGARGRQRFSFRPTLTQGQARLAVTGKLGTFSDSIRETIRVVPDGFPLVGTSSDLLEKSATHKITLPTWLPGTLVCQVDVYPSTLADLQKGLEGLLAEPGGCFEQSSTANYPNVLILDYLKTADQANPALLERTRGLLDRGYAKLTSFECQEPGKPTRRGYEWFGGTAPAHEALTAYGLMQFRDMARVHEVDAAMLQRTQEYLLARRDGKGGFSRNPRALDTFGQAPEMVTNAYIVWALTEADPQVDLTLELDTLARQATASKDPYFLSLVALGLANRGRGKEATALLERLATMQQADGHLDGADMSITGSRGRALAIETTALAMLGWMKTNSLTFDRPLRQAVRWIGQQRSGQGSFASTQSTILALKALIAWAQANKRTPEAGELRLFVGDQQVAELSFPAGVDRPLQLVVPDVEKRLRVGENTFRVEVTGKKNIFPHTLSWTCRSLQPASAKGAGVKLTTGLGSTTLEEGATTSLKVRVENVSGRNQGMAVAIVGLPAGLALPEDLKQLRDMIKIPTDGSRPVIDLFEVRGREVVLYWRDLAEKRIIDVSLDVVAMVPGSYRGPASRAYLYYDADAKHWVEPLTATIAAK